MGNNYMNDDILKICTKCGIEKGLDGYQKQKRGLHGVRSACRECCTAKHREYVTKRKAEDPDFKKHLSKISHKCRATRMKVDKEYHDKVVSQQRASNSKLMSTNPDAFRQHKDKKYASRKEKYNKDQNYRTLVNMRNRFNNILRAMNIKKDTSFSNGYDIDFKAIFEKLGPRPDGYTLEHIIPMAAFDVTNKRHVYLAHHPENLCWLHSIDNATKNDTIDMELILKSKILIAIYKEITENISSGL